MNAFTITSIHARRDRAQWLALRRAHLTATDWPKLMGSSRWGNAAGVFADKQVPMDEEPADGLDEAPSIPMRVGTALEPLILERIKQDWGPGDYLSQVFISRRILGFTPDLMLREGRNRWRLAEVKVSIRPWHDEVPAEVLDQVRFQATVLGLDEVEVVHLQLQSWAEGFQMIRSGSVSENRLTTWIVPVPPAERRRIQTYAEQWWKAHIA